MEQRKFRTHNHFINWLAQFFQLHTFYFSLHLIIPYESVSRTFVKATHTHVKVSEGRKCFLNLEI